ncbi:hypothetical protein D1105_01310 [Actinobacillus pleuropneumoniae]|nr:hypothetical protein D1112_01300 [Actinobacillus pleuropneumoniae]UKH40477.1 hypothetical protein D1097_01295 [Actinobacillus pleuropneumoniae serovar 4 str. M62]UKH15834.1 hypothetical protein D1111_01310 [Actinobacillus pleuropneumoniae]UKH24002.1 hypothetical protein D1107_01325 [Actinobacillus pleuropneumoniae]UKH25969.1 hypothetical protein D1106_01310 [Actinobacillus pleuropneumoniae]
MRIVLNLFFQSLFQDFFAKRTCKEFRFLYNASHTTTHCCEREVNAVRRSFLFFNNLSDNLCGHLLIDLI